MKTIIATLAIMFATMAYVAAEQCSPPPPLPDCFYTLQARGLTLKQSAACSKIMQKTVIVPISSYVACVRKRAKQRVTLLLKVFDCRPKYLTKDQIPPAGVNESRKCPVLDGSGKILAVAGGTKEWQRLLKQLSLGASPHVSWR
jgi:hypothetical protein